MVEGKHKSRTFRRVFRKTPGGRVVLQFRRRRPAKKVCSCCGKFLHGTPNLKPADIQKLPKSCRRPERPFGGVLCSACTRRKIIEKARV